MINKEEIDEIKANWKGIPITEELPEIQKLLLNLEERIQKIEEYLKLGV